MAEPAELAAYRGLSRFFQARGLDPPAILESHAFVRRLAETGFVATTAAGAGRPGLTVVFLHPNGKYARHTPDLRGLLTGLPPGEVMLFAGAEAARKRALVDVAREAGRVRGARCRFYLYGLLIFDQTAAVGVPPHRVLPPGERAALLEWWLAQPGDLPRIFDTDPGALWCGAALGDVVEIRRPGDTTAEAEVAYRLVAPAPE